jgi:PAS domain S-box-containing protein
MGKFVYLLPYLASLGLSLGILYYTWSHRFMRGAMLYMGYLIAQSISSVGFILELVSSSLAMKIFWDATQWAAISWLLLMIPPFVVNFAGYSVKKPRLIWGLTFIIPCLFVLLVATDSWHHLIYPDPHLIYRSIFPELDYSFTWAVDTFAVYGYLVTVICIGLLLNRIFRPHRLYRSQIAIIAIGFSFPLIGSMLSLVGIHVIPQRDASPLTYAVGNLIIAFGLFRFRLFDVVPVARDMVFENISDYVLVTDNQNRVVDFNTSMLALLGTSAKQITGQPAERVMNRWPDIVEKMRDTGYELQKEEFNIDEVPSQSVVEVEASPIFDRRHRQVGRVFVGRDITQRKRLELKLVDMARELEKRVGDRTKELAEAYDTTLEGWARALELRDKETEGHSRTVTELTLHLAMLMDIPQEELIHIRRGALLHDIGKMGIPDEILRKPTTLTPAERKVVETHPGIAFRLLAPITFLQKAMEIPYYHHEKWDGTGYPFGLKQEEIPLAARVFAVVDVWDAMRSERPYHGPIPEERVIVYIQEQSGKHFDPDVVKAFMKLYNQGWI